MILGIKNILTPLQDFIKCYRFCSFIIKNPQCNQMALTFCNQLRVTRFRVQISENRVRIEKISQVQSINCQVFQVSQRSVIAWSPDGVTAQLKSTMTKTLRIKRNLYEYILILNTWRKCTCYVTKVARTWLSEYNKNTSFE